MTEDDQEAHGGLAGAGSVAADDQEPLVASLDKSAWLPMARNPMTDSLVQTVWLQMAKEPHGGLPGADCVAADAKEPHG